MANKKRKPPATCGAAGQAALRVALDRRAQIAAVFRQQLITELGSAPATASRAALVDSCVSAYVQVSEVSRMYLIGRATPKALAQLGLARGQLARLLAALGLARDPGGDDPESTEDPTQVRGGIADYLAGRVAAAPDTRGDNTNGDT